MKSTSKLIIFVLTFLGLAASAYAQSPREQLQQMVEQLRNPCPQTSLLPISPTAYFDPIYTLTELTHRYSK